MDKRHFTVVIGSKEYGLYISSKPSSAAKKAVSKLCASNKSKKVEFSLREITQGSKKKTYGPYLGEMKKLKKPIELKGRVIRHEIKLHLKKRKSSTIKTAKKMRGGEERLRLTPQQLNEFIEKNNFQELLYYIFTGNIILDKILTESYENSSFFIRMINWINSFAPNENKNKYFFIICYIIAFRDEDHTIFKHLISVIGIDRFIEIVFQIDYGNDFDRIIESVDFKRMNERQINIVKSQLFMKLIEYYYKKMSLDEFKELLTKLFSIQNISFIKLILGDFFTFFIHNSYNGYQTINPSFKLLEFLLENKQQFQNFIRILKQTLDERSLISLNIEELIGTPETQPELFRNLLSN
jgi:hypothetical protein